MTLVDWHPYPDEKPTEQDAYKDFLLTVDIGSGPFVTKDQWLPIGYWDTYLYKEVIAWAEMPEPYRPTNPLDMHQDAVTARKYSEGDPETVKALHIFEESKE